MLAGLGLQCNAGQTVRLRITTLGVQTLNASGAVNGNLNHQGGYMYMQPYSATYDDGSQVRFYWDGNGSKIVYGKDGGTASPVSLQANLIGNASTASSAAQLTTARTISLGGDVSGSASFNGTANITITATVADNSHGHTIANVSGLQAELEALELAIAGTAGFYSGSSASLTNYPIGSLIVVEYTGGSFSGNRNASITCYYGPTGEFQTSSSGGVQLDGTWRAKGLISGTAGQTGSKYLMQRTA